MALKAETWFRIYYPGNSMPTEAIFEFQYDNRLDNQANPIYDNLITTYGATQVA
jgi:hypothetical protein